MIASWLGPELEPAPALVLGPVLGLVLGLGWFVEAVVVVGYADAFAAVAAVAAVAAADGSAPPLAVDVV